MDGESKTAVFSPSTRHRFKGLKGDKLDLDTDSKLESKLVEIITYQLALAGVFFGHQGGDTQKRR